MFMLMAEAQSAAAHMDGTARQHNEMRLGMVEIELVLEPGPRRGCVQTAEAMFTHRESIVGLQLK